MTRVAAISTAALVGYNLFLSQTHFHHNRAFLLILLIGLASTPCGRVLSLDALLQPGRVHTARQWPPMLLLFQLAMVYIASGLSKLFDPDWWGGLVNQIRVERYAEVVLDRGVPEWILDVLLTSGFHAWAAKIIVLTELFIGLGLLWSRTRLAALWVAVPFHVSIEITADVQVFSYAALAALVVWVTPVTRDREVVVGGDTAPARVMT
ncbi:MAG: HTTM domain-containing protein, partial [Actinomycetia bacterium]|nr:HTTM domain-containing protein [Actinomycetes bacterium]